MICCFFLSLYLHIHAVREKITERNDDDEQEEETRKALSRVSERERGKKELKFHQKFILNQIFFNKEKKTKKWCETQQLQQQTLRALSPSLREQKINLFLYFFGSFSLSSSPMHCWIGSYPSYLVSSLSFALSYRTRTSKLLDWKTKSRFFPFFIEKTSSQYLISRELRRMKYDSNKNGRKIPKLFSQKNEKKNLVSNQKTSRTISNYWKLWSLFKKKRKFFRRNRIGDGSIL